MTKSTLKALLGAAGVLAAWLAVSPNSMTPGTSRAAVAEPPVALHESTAENLAAQEARLRDHTGGVPPGSSTRDPFRFGSGKSPSTMPQPGSAAAPVVPTALPAPAGPSLALSGIAERKTPLGNRRTAIISGDGQLYLVTEGEIVAGRYRVVTVDSDAVTLSDDNGTEIRLSLK